MLSLIVPVYKNAPNIDALLAAIDGEPSVAMSEAAHGLRALDLPAGRHHVVTRFSPLAFWVGGVLSLLGWLVASACLIVPALRRRRVAS